MFEGYLRYGNTEIINAARAKAYAAGGCKPPDTVVDVPVACDGLGEALGDGTYRLPALDEAPWFEPENPDTHWFGGVIPLDVTGLDGSTYTATPVEGVSDGGVVTLARRGLRTIAVSALLIGRDAASVHAGLQWLTTILTRTCTTDETCGNGTTLEAFTTCPAPAGDTENLDAPFGDTVVDPALEWLTRDGSWDHAGRFTVTDQTVTLDGGADDTPDDADLDVYDGGFPDTDYTGLDVYDGGDVRGETGSGLLAAPTVFDCTLSEVRATWTITPTTTEPVTVRFGQVDTQGRVLDQDTDNTVAVAGATLTVEKVYLARFDEWTPAVWVEAPGADVTLTVSHRPYLTTDECLDPFRRTYTNVSTVAGPTVTASFSVDDDTDARLLQVEWTWVCGDPYRYTMPVTLVAGMLSNSDDPPTVLATGAATSRIPSITATDTACSPATDPPGVCAIDPDYPTFTAPPTVPTITDPDLSTPSAWHRRILELQPSLIPLTGVGAGVITLENQNATDPKRGIRVRAWSSATAETMFDGFGECDFDTEFTVTYLPHGGVLLIDSTAMTVTVVCANGRVFDGKHLVRGPHGGAFVFPTMSCDRRYWWAFDDPTGTDTLSVAVSLAVREG